MCSEEYHNVSMSLHFSISNFHNVFFILPGQRNVILHLLMDFSFVFMDWDKILLCYLCFLFHEKEIKPFEMSILSLKNYTWVSYSYYNKSKIIMFTSQFYSYLMMTTQNLVLNRRCSIFWCIFLCFMIICNHENQNT